MVSKLEDLLKKQDAMEDGSVTTVVGQIMASHVLADMIRAVELICDEKVGVSVAKEAMKSVANGMDQFENIDDMAQFEQKITQYTLSQKASFADALSIAYEKAANKYEASGRKKEAAEALIRSIDALSDVGDGVTESRQKQKNPEALRRRINICIRAANLLLDLDDVERASPLVTRVSDKLSELPAGDKSLLDHKFAYAKLYDRKHDFIRASHKYIELASLCPEKELECLESCARCVVLADAGPERSTVLNILFKNEQTPMLKCYPLLKRVYQQHILRENDIAMFDGFLLEHQKCCRSNEKMKPIERAVMLHNLFSAANIYTSIRLRSLADLLGISEEDAERTASDMIRQKRIVAKIDQTKGILHFSKTPDPLVSWDAHIDDMCNAADEAAEMIGNIKVSTDTSDEMN